MMNDETDLYDDPEEWLDDRPSKSQRKRELQALLELTEKALELSDEKLAATGLNEKALQAFKEVRKMKASGARNRQLKYISKLIRNEDVEVLEKYLEQAEASRLNETRYFHQLEKWRDRLIEEGDQAIGEYLDDSPSADRQQLRALVRQAQKEKSLEKPPVAARKLFKFLRENADKAL